MFHDAGICGVEKKLLRGWGGDECHGDGWGWGIELEKTAGTVGDGD